MTTPYTWKHGWADAYASNNGSDVEDYLKWVIKPSLAALEIQRQELARAAEDDVVFHFALSDHDRLTKRTHMTFALAVQSMWEQQLRSYMTTCASGCTIEGVTQRKLEKGTWGEVLNGVFFRVRGIELHTFHSYDTLTQLQMLGNACRHGEGDSSRSLYAKHSHLWPEWQLYPRVDPVTAPPPPFEGIEITLQLLTRYVAAISLFWLDMDRYGLESLVDKQPRLQEMIAKLLEKRVLLLEVITPSPRNHTAPSPPT